MKSMTGDLDRALDDVSASSAGGAPFLIAYGATFIITGILAFFLPVETAALVAMFQGGAALPVVLAGLGGVHFVPYAWLHRTRVYIFVGAAVALGAFMLQIWLRSMAFPYILFFVGAVYWVAAPILYQHAARVVRHAAA